MQEILEADVHIYCVPEPKDIEMIIPLEEIMTPYIPILLEPGRYALIVEFEGVKLDKQFVVSND